LTLVPPVPLTLRFVQDDNDTFCVRVQFFRIPIIIIVLDGIRISKGETFRDGGWTNHVGITIIVSSNIFKPVPTPFDDITESLIKCPFIIHTFVRTYFQFGDPFSESREKATLVTFISLDRQDIHTIR
jgi:hypothetical protein